MGRLPLRAFESEARAARVDSILIDPWQGDVRVSRSQPQTIADLLLRDGRERRVGSLLEPRNEAGSFHGHVGRHLCRESRRQKNQG